ncbi:ABC transporter ATP-binding protein [Streptococcus dentasini]
MTTMILETQGLSKVYSGREILSNCDLHVEEGSIYGLLGANGAGKTTIFKAVTGLIKPTAGQISIFGQSADSQGSAILADIGLLIETPIFYEHLSAKDNLSIHLAYMDREGQDIEAALRRVGLADTSQQPVSKFSLGMRQRLAIARAIVHRPKLLILDEPINGLDPMGIREMRTLFQELTAEGMTLMISSHILSEIEHVADTIGVLAGGRIVREVPMEQIRKENPNGLEDYFLSIMTGGDYA